jgi:hypothetical protein
MPKKQGYDHRALVSHKRQRVVDFLRRQKLEQFELTTLARAVSFIEWEEQSRWDFLQDMFAQRPVRHRIVQERLLDPELPESTKPTDEFTSFAMADYDYTTEEILQLYEDEDALRHFGITRDPAWRAAQFQAQKNRLAKDAPIVVGEHPLLQALKILKDKE